MQVVPQPFLKQQRTGKGRGYILLTVMVQEYMEVQVELRQGILYKMRQLLVIMVSMLKLLVIMAFLGEHYQQVMAV